MTVDRDMSCKSLGLKLAGAIPPQLDLDQMGASGRRTTPVQGVNPEGWTALAYDESAHADRFFGGVRFIRASGVYGCGESGGNY